MQVVAKMRYLRIEVTGIVQGVGFRPFVYRLAVSHGIKGQVANTPEGVEILACGEESQLERFLRGLQEEAPPQALVESIVEKDSLPFSATSFEIVSSRGEGEKCVLISPDLATCDDCLRELFDPADRRYLYPFINCTNCGPRFTIIYDTPYDRPLTSMAVFLMCEECEREYHDPSNRRFHAQPNACPVCGPRLWLTDGRGVELDVDPLPEAAKLLKEGAILAVKGLGGFHLACNALSDELVFKLRQRKNRYGKPLAVMVRSIEDAERYCYVDEGEKKLLLSPARPIVLLREREDSSLSPLVAKGLNHQGIFLPYTPIHHLLLARVDFPLVMTSGNISGEPIACKNEDALERLGRVADYFLMHDREILVRYDDSVTRIFLGGEYPLRRARGYAPYPVRVRASEVEVLALGAELKNTFCFLRGEQAFISQHIGDMETREALEHFEEALEAIQRLFSLNPQVVAHDLHPDYLTTQIAMDFPLPRIGVQHHHAHVVSCMAENLLEGEVIGVAWDGTGYGEDGTVWGGEFLVCDEKGYRRAAHLYRYPMPGGDACITHLHRMAMGVLSVVLGAGEDTKRVMEDLFRLDGDEVARLEMQLAKGINTPLTSSAGRLFDVVAVLVGLRREVEYEGQAACELEAVARLREKGYGFSLDRSSEVWVVDTRPTIGEILHDVKLKRDIAEIAGRFHTTMSTAIVDTCLRLGIETGITRVALSGGVFQNKLLTWKVVEGLREKGLEPILHRKVPCNDGGVSLGQAVIAASRYRSGFGGRKAARRSRQEYTV